jgi:hypothetical protein
MTMSRSRLFTLVAVAAGLLIFVAANAHLLVVAFESQPGCVKHARLGDAAPGEYTAAKSAC